MTHVGLPPRCGFCVQIGDFSILVEDQRSLPEYSREVGWGMLSERAQTRAVITSG